MDDSGCQEAVFALLADPATYGGEAVKRIDTHAASVFLAGDRALKVKRAVRFPFLDYSTLAKRESACEAELRINRSFAPEIYRRVVAITREADGALKLDGAGTAVEWAVEMRRFDENATLDRLAAGKIDAALSDALGRAVAALHARAGAVEAGPWIAALADYIGQNDAAFRALPEHFPPAEVELLTTKSRAAHARIRPLIVERGHRGLVRRLHGDLHLGNIVLLGGRPVAFDAIEFSALVASGDVLYDLAFLLMDLVERGLEPSANVVFNRYLAETRRTEDLDALAGLPLFLSMRAAIRAKVTAARLEHVAPDDTAAIMRGARAYFDFARRFIAPSAPRLLAVGGLSGTGKSALACALAAACAGAGGRGAALRRRTQDAARQGRAREVAGGCLFAGGDGAGLRHHRRQGAPRACSRPFGGRRCGLCAAAGARGRDGIRRNPRRALPRSFPRRRSRHARGPRERARARRLRCRRHGRPPPGDLRPRRARLDAHRCLRLAGGNLRPRADGDGAVRA